MKKLTLLMMLSFLLCGCGSRFDKDYADERWETSNRQLTIRISTHLEKGIFPILKGAYYVYSSTSEGSGAVTEIMTVRQDDPVPIDPNSVHFVNDDVCYVYLGSQFAVTTDGGRSWATWDSREWLSREEGPSAIRRVNIQSGGNGEMEIWIFRGNRCQNRITSNFGRTWDVAENGKCTDFQENGR